MYCDTKIVLQLKDKVAGHAGRAGSAQAGRRGAQAGAGRASAGRAGGAQARGAGAAAGPVQQGRCRRVALALGARAGFGLSTRCTRPVFGPVQLGIFS